MPAGSELSLAQPTCGEGASGGSCPPAGVGAHADCSAEGRAEALAHVFTPASVDQARAFLT